MKYFAGVDLGGSSAKIGLVDPSGNILKQDRVSINARSQFVNIMTLISHLLEELHNDTPGELAAIGIGAPGFIESQTGILLAGARNIPNLRGNSLTDFFKDKFNVPVFADNDATCAAAGELEFGIGKKYKNFVLLTLGTGIGGGLVLNGKVFRGSRGFAGEIGHVCLDPGGVWCNCGSRGCFEQYASAPAILRNYKEKCKKRGSRFPENISTKDIFQLAGKGEKCAEAAVEEAASAIARVLGICINLLNLEACIIGGGVSRAGDILLKPVTDKIDDFAWSHLRKDVEIHIAQLQNNAGLLGAAAQVLERLSI